MPPGMLWRDPRRAGVLMVAYFLLALPDEPVVYVTAGSQRPGLAGHVFGALALAFFAWRVTRGGRISRMWLILGSGAGFLATAFEIASRFGPLVLVLLAIGAAQLALLLSPAVFLHTRPRDWAGPTRWDRVRPPAALLVFAALAGLVITLVGLGHMTISRGSPSTMTALDGFPLSWLTAQRDAIVVSWSALLKDLLEFTVVSASVLYALWLGPRTRAEPTGITAPFAAVFGCVLAGLTLSAVTGGFPWTWVAVSQGWLVFDQTALLRDTALWSVIALCGWLAVRAVRLRRSAPLCRVS